MSYPLMIDICQTICADMTPSVLRPSKLVRKYIKNPCREKKKLEGKPLLSQASS